MKLVIGKGVTSHSLDSLVCLCRGFIDPLALSGILLLVASFAVTAAHAQPPFERHYDGVLGTSLDITIYGADQSGMEAAVDAALAEITRLETVLSTFIVDSDVMQLNSERSTSEASPALLEVVSACEQWLESSGGDFSCRLGEVLALWDTAEAEQIIPVRSEVLDAARAANASDVTINGSAIALGDGISLEPSGLAKGYIIDRAMDVLRARLPDAQGIKLDIGGDGRYFGSPPGRNGWQVRVADPANSADNDGFITSLSVNSLAVATSGHGSRSRTIRGREFSHILTPRNGWPVINGLYAVVVAPDAMTADALATTLSVRNLNNALALVDSLDNVEALLIDSNGNQRASLNWETLLSDDLQRQSNATIEMTLIYTLPDLQNTGGYYRPYVAIWVSDTGQAPIKNLLLLGREQRWAQTNSRWWRRAGRRGTLETVSVTRPTRGPGEYQLIWNGLDDLGRTLPPGDYLLNIEASREHGGHDYLSVPFTLAEGSQTFSQAGSGELGDVEMSIEMSLPQ